MTSTVRLCACGCGRALPSNAPRRRVWASKACKQRGYRRVEQRRADDRAASVAAAVAHRGPLNVGELLELARREARRKPGSVVLRVAGRLVTLSVEDLEQLAGGPPKGFGAELAEQIQRVIQSWAVMRREGETVKLATRIAPLRSVVSATDQEIARLAVLSAGEQPRPARPVVPAELLALRQRLEDLARWPLLEEGGLHLIPHEVFEELINSLDRALPPEGG